MYSAFLRDANAIILPDNDEQGRKHIDKVAASLVRVGAMVRVLDLPGLGPKDDVINWAAAGGTVEQLHELIEREARAWEPSSEWRAGNRHDETSRTILIGLDTIEPEPIDWIWKYWLARGKLHIIAGAPGDGKTTVLLSWIAAISSGGMFPDGTSAPVGNCLIWTNEDGLADTINRA